MRVETGYEILRASFHKPDLLNTVTVDESTDDENDIDGGCDPRIASGARSAAAIRS